MTTAITPPEFDAALIARYDVAGPRYTSYPTAPHFTAEFDETALRGVIRASNEEPIPRPLSLYVHVPFCTSPCFYCGCNRIITRDATQADRYLQRLYREIELIAPLFDRDRPVRQLHFGGGTPNFLDTTQMGELLESLGRHFSFSHAADREYGIEIDPRFADGAYIRALGELGFNRISVGIQDFDPAVQKAVNRIQSFEQTREVLEAARTSSFRSASVDLIYGLPLQTVEGFSRTLDQVVALDPDRVAVYGYAHLPEMFKAQRQIAAADMPDPAVGGRLRLCRHGSLRQGQRRTGAGAARRYAAAQLPGLLDAWRLRHRGPGRERDRTRRRQLQPERARPDRLLRRAGCRAIAGGAGAATG